MSGKKGSKKKEVTLESLDKELRNTKAVLSRMFGTSTSIRPFMDGKREVVEGGKPPANSGTEMLEYLDGFHPARDVTEFSMYDDARFEELTNQNPVMNVPGLSFKVRGTEEDDEDVKDSDEQGSVMPIEVLRRLEDGEEPRFTGPPTRANKNYRDMGVKTVKAYVNTYTSPKEVKGFHYHTLTAQVASNTIFMRDVIQPLLRENANQQATILRLEHIVSKMAQKLDEISTEGFSVRGEDVPGIRMVIDREIPEVPVVKVPQIQGAVDDYKNLEEGDVGEGGPFRYWTNGPKASSTSWTKITREQEGEDEGPLVVSPVIAGKTPVGHQAYQLMRQVNAESMVARPFGSSDKYVPESVGTPSPLRRQREEAQTPPLEEDEEYGWPPKPKRVRNALEDFASSPDGTNLEFQVDMARDLSLTDRSSGSFLNPKFGDLINLGDLDELVEKQAGTEWVAQGSSTVPVVSPQNK